MPSLTALLSKLPLVRQIREDMFGGDVEGTDNKNVGSARCTPQMRSIRTRHRHARFTIWGLIGHDFFCFDLGGMTLLLLSFGSSVNAS